MGLYKLCSHKGRLRDRCDHVWWGSFRGVRVSLSKWANRDVTLKTDAQAVLDDVRAAIRAGTFDPRGQVVREITPMTCREFAEIYKERHAIAKGLSLARTIDWRLGPLLDRFGDRALADIKTADVKDLIADLRKPRIVGREPVPRSVTAASVNRTVELLRHMMNWAVGREYIDRTPFRRGSETLIKRLLEDNKRRRRLSEDDEAKLLAAAPLHLRAMIIAALDTGMRRGEMLALRFADIDWTRELIVLRGETTKSRKTRMVPISTERLRAVLAWLRLDAEGEPKPADTAIFSNEIGEPLPQFHDVWLRTVLKAHGVRPRWAVGHDYKGLSTECKAAYRRIDLRWHDLRHEYASRLVERGVPLAQVRDLLGHASITTTERYDTQKLENLQAAVTRLERGLAFSAEAASWTPEPNSRANLDTDTRPRVAPGRTSLRQGYDGSPELQRRRMHGTREPRDHRAGRRPVTPFDKAQGALSDSRSASGRSGPGAGPGTGPAVASGASPGAQISGDNLSSFFQELGSDAPIEASDEALAAESNSLPDLNLEDWLGGRDSTPFTANRMSRRRMKVS